MKRTNYQNLIASTGIAMLGLCSTARLASGVPVQGVYIDDPRCDQLANRTLTHELGDATVFPQNEAFVTNVTPANFTVCVPDDGLQNDWIVEIRNVSGIAWQDLFFDCDHNVTVGNADGMIADLSVAAVTTDAFRIDGTVTNALNNNLLFESINNDEIFQPGELWRFNVSNYMAINSQGVFEPPRFLSPGIFSGSTNFPQTPGNASILAVPVPEPTTIGALGLVCAGLLMRRPRRA